MFFLEQVFMNKRNERKTQIVYTCKFAFRMNAAESATSLFTLFSCISIKKPVTQLTLGFSFFSSLTRVLTEREVSV